MGTVFVMDWAQGLEDTAEKLWSRAPFTVTSVLLVQWDTCALKFLFQLCFLSSFPHVEN